MNIFRFTNTLSDYFEKPGDILLFSPKKGNFGAGFKAAFDVLIALLTQYLESHKRLVIPQLGAFIVKEPGQSVLFSELLKRDDGILRGLLRERGMNDLEAAGEIDRLVFEVRHAVENGQEYRLEGFGTFAPGPNGTIAFRYEPQPAAGAAASSPAAAAEPSPVATDATAPDASPAGVGGRKSPQHLHPERVAEAVRTAFTEPHVSRSAKMNPDPSVRGLRYGKPPKNTDAYTYVDRPPRRRADWFILIGVVVAVLALGAIVFGLWNDAREQQPETEVIDLPTTPDEPAPQTDGTPAAE